MSFSSKRRMQTTTWVSSFFPHQAALAYAHVHRAIHLDEKVRVDHTTVHIERLGGAIEVGTVTHADSDRGTAGAPQNCPGSGGKNDCR